MQMLFLVGTLLLFIGLFMLWVSVAVNAVLLSTWDLNIAGSIMISAGAMGK
jgi:hypothetical protein